VGFEEGFPAKYNYGKQKPTVKRPPNASPVAPIEYKMSKKGGFEFHCEQINSLITGAIRLGPGKSKPESKTSCNHSYMFLVRSGQTIIKMISAKGTKSVYADENSGWITLPPGNRYMLKNCGSRINNIAYIVKDI